MIGFVIGLIVGGIAGLIAGGLAKNSQRYEIVRRWSVILETRINRVSHLWERYLAQGYSEDLIEQMSEGLKEMSSDLADFVDQLRKVI